MMLEKSMELDFTGTTARASTHLPISNYFGVNVCIVQRIVGKPLEGREIVSIRESDIARLAELVKEVREEAERTPLAIC